MGPGAFLRTVTLSRMNLPCSKFHRVWKGSFAHEEKYALKFVIAFGFLSVTTLVPVCQTAETKSKKPVELVSPVVFQAAGPTAASIEGTVNELRAALGEPNNGNTLAALGSGRREINWDGGGGVDATTPPVTLNIFLNTRGGQFTTPGMGSSQAARWTTRRPRRALQQSCTLRFSLASYYLHSFD